MRAMLMNGDFLGWKRELVRTGCQIDASQTKSTCSRVMGCSIVDKLCKHEMVLDDFSGLFLLTGLQVPNMWEWAAERRPVRWCRNPETKIVSLFQIQ